MRPENVDLALEGRRLVLMGHEALRGRTLEIGRHLIGVRDQTVHKVLAIDRLEVSTI